jgi:outer membrane translocation and assembly module TamA
LYGIGADLGHVDDARDPSRGLHARTELRRAKGVGSADPDYKQWWLEGRAYVPVFAKRRVLAFRGVYTGIDPSGGSIIPFYRLVQSGANAHFAGFNEDRFRDRRLMLARVEYRWAIIRRLSAVALYEVGEVGPNSGTFTLRGLHKSYGVGARLGLTNRTAFRGELADGVEGIRMVLALGSDW